ncbi:MAG: OmpH family outer membrane protein [Bacteroidales bacterium]|nr:OmpH family outer membrane protein [Bacteroidales bacterium]
MEEINNTPGMQPPMHEQTENQTVMEPNLSKGDYQYSRHNKVWKTFVTVGVILALLGVIVLVVLHVAGNNSTNVPASAVADTSKGITIAYVNTDSLMAKYQYAIDLQQELKTYQAAKEREYKQKAENFQRDYENYLKTGDKLTLSQQQSTEKNLQERMQKIQGLEGEYAQQIQLKTLTESEKMTKAVYNFIRDYNEKYLHYDIILSKSFSNTAVLYGNPGIDITDVIIEGLNKEYASLDKNKKQ